MAENGKKLTDDIPNYTKEYILQIGEILEI